MRTEPVGVNMWTDDGEPRAAARASAFSIRFCATELAQEDGDARMGETATQGIELRAMQKQKFASWQRKKRRRAARKPRQNCAA